MSNIKYLVYKIHFKKMGGLLTADALSDINRQPNKIKIKIKNIKK